MIVNKYKQHSIMASSQITSTCGSVSKTYNSKKAVFLYKDAATGEYSAIHHSFILTNTVNKIIGQFITTNWFKIACDTRESVTFGIAWVHEDTPYKKVEEFVNSVAYDKLFKFNQFTIDTEKMRRTYQNLTNDEKNNRSVSVVCMHPASGYHVFAANARLYYKSGEETCQQNKLLISLPTFEYDSGLF